MKNNNNNRGFIKIAIVIIAALILLKYVYEIDVLDKVYEWVLAFWEKYGDRAIEAWEWIKAKFQ